MKILLVLAALTGVAFGSSAFACSPSAPGGVAPVPVPAKVVNPTGLPPQFAGKVVNIEFKLDAAGEPRDIKILDVDNLVLRRQLTAAFRQWRFAAATSARPSGERRFILPLELRPEA